MTSRKVIMLVLLFLLTIASFAQRNDTIIDSRHNWTYFQNKFKAQYSDSSKYNFTDTEKRRIESLLTQRLALVDVVYMGYDSKIHAGQIICNKAIASDVKKIFTELLQLSFPIYQCKPISEFDFNDLASMQANNTTGFDFRLKTSKNGLSNHSYGFAIDLNPLQNPYQRRGITLPLNRNENIVTGRIRNTEETGKKVIAIFRKYGWTWGGNWRSLKDFMHFQKG